jgi:type III pantothenate kinase
MKQNRLKVLTVDVGNTHAHFGMFEDESLTGRCDIPSGSTVKKYTEVLSKLLRCAETGVVIGSVVPPVTRALEELLSREFSIKPLVVSHKLPLGIRICYDNPSRLGADRIAHVVGGFTLYGGPLLIVSFGTAVTFEVVSGKGDFVGGAIAPGLHTMFASLHEKTAQLPKLSREKTKKAKIGRDTESSIEFGVAHGADGAIKEIIKSLKESCRMHVRLKLVATGGDAEYFAKRLAMFDYVNRDLTLIGLREIYERIKMKL